MIYFTDRSSLYGITSKSLLSKKKPKLSLPRFRHALGQTQSPPRDLFHVDVDTKSLTGEAGRSFKTRVSTYQVHYLPFVYCNDELSDGITGRGEIEGGVVAEII